MQKILVIEDAAPLRNDIIEMLTYEGFSVIGAENGATGVEAAKSYQPDLIVCDIMMPELDGYDVLDRLRQDGMTAAIPFIFLTAKTDRADMRFGMGMGADDYLTKPFMAAELLDTIRARLDRREVYDILTNERISQLTENIITALPHELRTPLNTVIGFSNMIATEAHRLKPGQVTEWAMFINDAALRLYRLVENYLTFARAETLIRDQTRMEAVRQSTTEPGGIIQFQAILKAQQHKRENDLVMKLDESVERIHISDQDLGKITEEILDNAFKFSEKDTPIKIETRLNNGTYTIRFTDEGKGMSDEQVKQVGAHLQFERFIDEQQGSGLGLAIAKRLTEVFGGKLEIESKLDKGTTIIVQLPV